MFGNEKNLKDSDLSPTPLLNKERGEGVRWLSYTKTNKLITALYMVTDIMDKDEPIRNKLRTLGIEIISDTSAMSKTVFDSQKIDQIMSFLDIASAMNFISEMNCSILKKEFLELKKSMQEHIDIKPTWLEGFLVEGFLSPLNKGRTEEGSDPHLTSPLLRGRGNATPKGHIGIQKASTLMKAIKDMHLLSGAEVFDRNHFNILKQERRSEIIRLVKAMPNGATISDIKTNTIVQGSALHNISEKTLQRELMSMTKDGVLNKTGEKRWSRYLIRG